MPDWIWKIWPMKNYAAITLPWGVFYNPFIFIGEPTVKHEQKHLEQIKRLGVIRFYSSYIFEYLKNLLKYHDHWKAYFMISFEIEARRAELE